MKVDEIRMELKKSLKFRVVSRTLCQIRVNLGPGHTCEPSDKLGN